jgi:hypothetical protein
VNKEATEAVTNVKIIDDILAMKQTISDLSSKVQDIATSIKSICVCQAAPTLISKTAEIGITSADAASCPSADSKSIASNQASYAHVLTKDLSEVIKSTVAESIKSQQQSNRILSSLVIHGFPEKGDDFRDVQNLLKSLNCNDNIISLCRIGRPPVSSSGNTAPQVKCRPLKIELRSAADCSYILSRTKLLKKDASTSNIFISQWMSRSELEKVKLLRQKCRELNKDCVPDGSGRLPFMVISGKLMMRNKNGELHLWNDKNIKGEDNQAPKNNETKNGVVGSQEAPSISQ